ncbi:MAG: adenylyl-sulfate kinase [Dermatophilaceae bacterium]
MTDSEVALPDLDIVTLWRRPRRQRGVVVMFTGLSGSGKSTLARGLARRIRERGHRTVTLIDADVVRRLLWPELGYDWQSRRKNVRRLGLLSAEIARHGGVAICAPIAPYETSREQVRAMAQAVGDFVLVYLDTPLQDCERRDVKGLYSQARTGRLTGFTGVSDPYEPPTDAALRIDTSTLDIEQAVSQIYTFMQDQGWLA